MGGGREKGEKVEGGREVWGGGGRSEREGRESRGREGMGRETKGVGRRERERGRRERSGGREVGYR